MKQFWKPAAWKFAVLAMIALVAYAVFRSDEPLDFHESWSPAERGQMLECFQTCCDAHNQLGIIECSVFVTEEWPEDGSWSERACRWVYDELGSYSRGMLHGYLNKSTRRMIEQTASTGNVMLVDKKNQSLLHLTLACGFYDLAQSLVERGADVNRRAITMDGTPEDTPLSWAVYAWTIDKHEPISLSRCREMVECLLAHGADIKAPAVDNLPVTIQGLLNMVVGKGERRREAEELMVYLVEKGAPQEWKTSEGKTSSLLVSAISFKSSRLVRYLLDHGADASILTAEEQKELKEVLEKNDLEESSGVTHTSFSK